MELWRVRRKKYFGVQHEERVLDQGKLLKGLLRSAHSLISQIDKVHQRDPKYSLNSFSFFFCHFLY